MDHPEPVHQKFEPLNKSPVPVQTLPSQTFGSVEIIEVQCDMEQQTSIDQRPPVSDPSGGISSAEQPILVAEDSLVDGETVSNADLETATLVPGKSINVICENTNLLRTEILLNGHVATSIVDTGAVSSLISAKLAQELGLNVLHDPKRLSVVGDNNFTTFGTIKTSVTIHGVKMLN